MLLGRAKRGFPCPVNGERLVDTWHKLLPPDIVDAYRLLLSRSYDFRYNSTDMTKFKIVWTNKVYNVRFVVDSPYGLTNSFLSYHTVEPIVPLLGLATASGASEEEWIHWLENCSQIDREFEPVQETLSDVLEFCGTIGQLKRAIPDLVSYLPRESQRQLMEQTRSSNMPYEWASFDRSRIEALQTAMAKASLFPDHPVGRNIAREYESINETWASYG